MSTFTYFNYKCESCYLEDKILQEKYNPNKYVQCNGCDNNTKLVVCDNSMRSSCPNMVTYPKDKLAYYGVKDINTGEGITKYTDVRDPIGIRV